MQRKLSMAVVGVLGFALTLTACGDDSNDSGDDGDTGNGGDTAAGKIGVILPDTESSVRWETADRPALEAAFEAAGVEYDIQNAEGDAEKMAHHRRRHDRRRRHRARDRQPRLRVGRGDPGEGGLPGRQDHRLRPADPGWLGRLLRVVRQHRRR